MGRVELEHVRMWEGGARACPQIVEDGWDSLLMLVCGSVGGGE